MLNLLYKITPEKHNKEALEAILVKHPEVQFVSFMGIDLGGNGTDEKIPIKLFIEDIEEFLSHGVQTDGSSVVLHGIAVLNNAKVDIVPDLEVNWFVDYNFEFPLTKDASPCGTLIIPSFLVHNGSKIDSRSILKRACENFENTLTDLFIKYPETLKALSIDSFEEIEKINLTSATELEFWVRTPDNKANIEKLSTSQVLKEQYWKRTKGSVRSALEETIKYMELLGLEPEMGHKEVGGVKSKIGITGKMNSVMEQLEIDWKYSNALQTGDNEIIARNLVADVFRRYGLEVTFEAKPIENVAGSGEHTHVGASVKLKNGKIINLFSPTDPMSSYMSNIGFGALMGLLKNYEVVGPFVTASNDAFNRLKPGFEAPVCIVTSLGHTVENPSRNRSILVGLIRDMDNPLATRFELRAPNPHSNTYLVIASIYQAMLDGIIYAITSGKTLKELEASISKTPGKVDDYLETSRAYRSEEDVFEHFTDSERDNLFGIPPYTVYENITNFEKYEDKKASLLHGKVFTNEIIESFKMAALSQWITEIENRIIPGYVNIVKTCKLSHDSSSATDIDVVRWEKINSLRCYLMKDSLDRKSLFTRVRLALDNHDFSTASTLQIEMGAKIHELRELYSVYKRNLFDVED